MKIQEIMTKNPNCVTPDATVREAAQVMRKEDVGIVPVVGDHGDRKLVGVITDRDIAVRCIADGHSADSRVGEVMTGNRITTCSVDDDVSSVMAAMQTEKVRRIPIVDERGSLVGIVAQADLVTRTNDGSRAADTIERISEPGGRHTN